MSQNTKANIRKINMKLYPIYEMFGLDFMFYYAIELLFFTQIKAIPVANVVLLDSFYAIFSIISQFIVIFIVNKIGKKRGLLLALLSMIAMIWALLCIQSTYNTAILKDIGMSAGMIGLISALMELIKGLYSEKANDFNKKYSNTLLTRIALTICLAMITWGIVTLFSIDYRIQALIIILSSTFIYILKGVYQIIKKRYMSNFMRVNTLTKIYSVNSIMDNLVRMIVSYIGSVILNFMNIRYASLFMGIVLAIFVFMISLYMKSRVGLSPEHYDETDVET